MKRKLTELGLLFLSPDDPPAGDPPADDPPPSDPPPADNDDGDEDDPAKWDPERAKRTIQNFRRDEKKWKQEQKELADLRKAKKEADDAALTAQEKAEKERDAALARAAKLERNEKLREIGKKHNLSDDLSLRLVGETDEELDEDAKRLAKLVKTADEKKKAPETDAGKKDKAGAGAPKSSENGKAPVQRYQSAYDVPWPD